MKITIDTGSDLAKQFLSSLKMTKNFYILMPNIEERARLTIYDHDGFELASVSTWYLSPKNVREKLLQVHEFNDEELREISKIYNLFDKDE